MGNFFFSKIARKDAWPLFLAVIFPVHIWAILIGFWNFQRVVERSANLVDGIAYLSYALFAALLESILIFIFLFLVAFLFPKRFSSKRNLAQLLIIGTTILGWMIIDQLLAFVEFQNPGALAGFFLQFSRPYLFTMAGGALLLGILIFLLAAPFFWIERSPGVIDKMETLITKLAPLSILYLGLDLFAIIFIVIRNI